MYAGLKNVPKAFAGDDATELTQEDADEWTREMRDSFRQICLVHMCSRAEAWVLLKERILQYTSISEASVRDDLAFVQEVLAGFVDPTADQLIRQCKRWQEEKPLQRAIEELLSVKKPERSGYDARRSAPN